MERRITISGMGVSLIAELNFSQTAEAILAALPIEGVANTWGEEVYFTIPVDLPMEPDARADVQVGELGYWPAGKAFCIFFGPTPASTGDQPRAASPVNVFGKVSGDAKLLRQVRDGERVWVALAK